MILPALNEPDLAELPEEIRKDMTFIPVETLEQVVSVALDGSQKTEIRSQQSGGSSQAADRRHS